MTLRVYGTTDQGKRRSDNEDALLLDSTQGVYAVADGMGGLPGGKQASSRLIEMLAASSKVEPLASHFETIIPKIEYINEVLRHEFLQAHPFTGAGTTLTMAIESDGALQLAHIGDSAAYRLRGGTLEKLTTDHTLESKYIQEKGEAAREQMPREYAHTLTQCIGLLDDIEIDQIKVDLEINDRIILCTDGLSNALETEKIKQILSNCNNPQSACERLTQAANNEGGPDNITIIALFVE